LSMLFLMSFISNFIDEPQNVLQFSICQDNHYVRLRHTRTEPIQQDHCKGEMTKAINCFLKLLYFRENFNSN
jgi:hypothetical protein